MLVLLEENREDYRIRYLTEHPVALRETSGMHEYAATSAFARVGTDAQIFSSKPIGDMSDTGTAWKGVKAKCSGQHGRIRTCRN